MRRALVLAVAASLLVAATAAGQEAVTGEVQGYLEMRHVGVFGLDPVLADLPFVDFDALGFHPDEGYGSTYRLRPTAKLHFGESATLVATAEGHVYQGFFGRPADGVGDVVDLERLYVTVSDGVVDLAAGKQFLAWGHGLVLNPTSWFDDRPVQDRLAEGTGVWAVRGVVARGDTASLTAVAATFPRNCCDLVAAGRLESVLGLTDVAATVLWDRGEDVLLLGLDAKGEVEAGLWAEVAARRDLDDEVWALSAEVGADYTIDVLDGWYTAFMYVFQSDGVDSDYLEARLRGEGSRRSGLLGISTAAALTRLTVSGDFRVQALNLTNVADPSGLLLAQATFTPADAFEFDLGTMVTYGSRGGEYTLAIPETVPGMPGVPMPERYRGLRVTPPLVVFLWGRYYY